MWRIVYISEHRVATCPSSHQSTPPLTPHMPTPHPSRVSASREGAPVGYGPGVEGLLVRFEGACGAVWSLMTHVNTDILLHQARRYSVHRGEALQRA